MPSHERRSVETRPPTVVMQALDNLTKKQKNVLFYWALVLISAPLVTGLVLVISPFAVTWTVVVVLVLPVFAGIFLLSPPMAYKLVDMILRRLGSLMPRLGKLIHKDRRDNDEPDKD